MMGKKTERIAQLERTIAALHQTISEFGGVRISYVDSAGRPCPPPEPPKVSTGGCGCYPFKVPAFPPGTDTMRVRCYRCGRVEVYGRDVIEECPVPVVSGDDAHGTQAEPNGDMGDIFRDRDAAFAKEFFAKPIPTAPKTFDEWYNSILDPRLKTGQSVSWSWRELLECWNAATAAHNTLVMEQERETVAAWQRKLESAVAAEREACAQILDIGNFLSYDSPECRWAKQVSALIRARGKQAEPSHDDGAIPDRECQCGACETCKAETYADILATGGQ